MTHIFPDPSCMGGARKAREGLGTKLDSIPLIPHLCCSRDKTSRTERLNQRNRNLHENGEEREALLPRRRLIIDVLRDTGANGSAGSVY